MEPLIKLRLQYSHLRREETGQLMQTIMKSFGPDQIISVFFNHFIHKYSKSKVHDENVQNIKQMISKIIDSRKEAKKPKAENTSKEEPLPIQIDTLPSQMIRNCASFLQLKDYMNFSKANGTIYCASNSPCSLKELDLRHCIRSYEHFHFDRFQLLESLRVSGMRLQDCSARFGSDVSRKNKFSHLKALHIDYDCLGSIQCLSSLTESPVIPYAQITKLTLSCFGNEAVPFHFGSFCKILDAFPNVSDLALIDLDLSDFEENNKNIKKGILPNLSHLRCGYLGSDESANLLRNKLIKLYSNQLIAIGCDEWSKAIDLDSAVKLEKISICNASRHSVENMMNAAPSLKHLELYKVKESGWMRKSIVKSISLPAFEYLSLSALKNEMENILPYLEIGLIESKELNKNSLRIEIIMPRKTTTEDDIRLFINRLVNALDTSNTEHFKLVFRISVDTVTHDYMNEICSELRESHLVLFEHQSDKTSTAFFEIVISNKDCRMPGCHTKISEDF